MADTRLSSDSLNPVVDSRSSTDSPRAKMMSYKKEELGQALKHYTVFSDTLVERILGLFGLSGKTFASALYVSIVPALISLLLRLLASEFRVLPHYYEGETEYLKIPSQAWTGITGFLAFLVVFRAQQAYGRYWQALTSVHLMRAEWFESCSALASFCSRAEDPATVERVRHFKQRVVRFFSLCHAGALFTLIEPGVDNDAASEIPMLDPNCIDKDSITAFQSTPHKVELVSQWIQHLIVKSLDDKVLSVAPPIATRSLQELANGIVKYHDAVKVKTIPFPKQYQEACHILLMIHWVMTPILISLWVNSPFFASLFTFLAVFTLWSLIMVCKDIENPFCMQSFIKDSIDMQTEFNSQLTLLLDPRCTRIPALPGLQHEDLSRISFPSTSLSTFWNLEQRHSTTDHHLFRSTWEPLPATPAPATPASSKAATEQTDALCHMLASILRDALPHTRRDGVTRSGSREQGTTSRPESVLLEGRGEVTSNTRLLGPHAGEHADDSRLGRPPISI